MESHARCTPIELVHSLNHCKVSVRVRWMCRLCCRCAGDLHVPFSCVRTLSSSIRFVTLPFPGTVTMPKGSEQQEHDIYLEMNSMLGIL